MKRSGFATFTGLGLVLLVAAVLGTLSGWFAFEVRRTHRETADAQLRQLLIAGAAAAPAHFAQASAAPPPPVSLSLPADLLRHDARLLLRLEPAPAGERRAVVEARYGAHHARQRLRFLPERGAWRLAEARLDP